MDDNNDIRNHIREYVIELIESGRLPEGEKLPSEHELAERFHVNRNRARRVLRDLEVEGYVLRSQGRRSIVAPRSARQGAFRIAKAPVLALVLPRYLNPFEREIADGFMRYAAWQEVNGMIYTIRFDEKDEKKFLLSMPETGIAGLAFWPQNDSPVIADALKTLWRRRFPVVQVDRYVDGADTDFVVTDNEAMIYDLTIQLIQRKHRDIAFVYGLNESSTVRDRLAGFMRALLDYGLDVDAGWCKSVHPEDAAAVSATIMKMMVREPSPSAFVCANGMLATAVLQELDRLHVRVPQQVDIAFVDDLSLAAGLNPSLLHLSQPGAEIGRSAAEQILARLYDFELPLLRRFLPATLEG